MKVNWFVFFLNVNMICALMIFAPWLVFAVANSTPVGFPIIGDRS